MTSDTSDHVEPRMRPDELFTHLQDTGAALRRTLAATLASLRKDMPNVDPYAVTTLNGDHVVAPIVSALGNVYSAMSHLYLSGEVQTSPGWPPVSDVRGEHGHSGQ